MNKSQYFNPCSRGQFCCFQYLVILNKAAVNIRACFFIDMSLWISWATSKSKIACSEDRCTLNSYQKLSPVSDVIFSLFTPVFRLFCAFVSIWYSQSSQFNHSNRYLIVTLVVIFSMSKDNSDREIIRHLCISLCEKTLQFFCPV